MSRCGSQSCSGIAARRSFAILWAWCLVSRGTFTRAEAEPFVMDESWETVPACAKRAPKQSPSPSSGSNQAKALTQKPKNPPGQQMKPRTHHSQPAGKPGKSPSSSLQSSSAPPRPRCGTQTGQLDVNMTSQTFQVWLLAASDVCEVDSFIVREESWGFVVRP